jgi:hypothetical protein
MTNDDDAAVASWNATPIAKALPWVFGVVFLALAVLMVVAKLFDPAFVVFMALMLIAAAITFRAHRRNQPR